MDRHDVEIQNELKADGNLPGHVAIIMDGNGRWRKDMDLSELRDTVPPARLCVTLCGPVGNSG